MGAITTKGAALINPSMFLKSETEFIKAFPNDFKLSMFRNCTLKECDDELKELYAIYGKPKKVKKQK